MNILGAVVGVSRWIISIFFPGVSRCMIPILFFRTTRGKLFRYFVVRLAVNCPIFCRSSNGEFFYTLFDASYGHYLYILSGVWRRAFSRSYRARLSMNFLDVFWGVARWIFWITSWVTVDRPWFTPHTWFRHETYWTWYFERILLDSFLLCLRYTLLLTSHGIHEVHREKT